MSHLSQLVSDALANARIADGVVMHEASRDRVLVNLDGKPHYVVCMTEEEMEKVFDAMRTNGDVIKNYPDDRTVDKFRA